MKKDSEESDAKKAKTEKMLARYRKKDPDAKVSDVKDGLNMLIVLAAVGLFFVAAGIIGFCISAISVSGEKAFFENAETISGTVTKTKSQGDDKNSPIEVSYKYRFDDKSFEQNETISRDMAKVLNLSGGDSDKGKEVLVYIDSADPGHAEIEYQSQQPLYILFVICLIGIPFIAAGIMRFLECKDGRLIIYNTKSGRHMVRINSKTAKGRLPASEGQTPRKKTEKQKKS